MQVLLLYQRRYQDNSAEERMDFRFYEELESLRDTAHKPAGKKIILRVDQRYANEHHGHKMRKLPRIVRRIIPSHGIFSAALLRLP